MNVPAARSAIRFAVLCAATAVCLLVAASSALGFGFLTKWGSEGSDAGELSAPFGIATDTSGNVYVSERDNERIQVFDSSGEFLRMWGWGVDNGANAFQVCTSTCQAGIEGSGAGQFDNPFDVEIGPDGNVYVVEGANDRIQRFSPSGSLNGGWGLSGTDEGEFELPSALGTDPMGNVYVADTANNRIQKFTSAGVFVRMWGWGVDNGANAFQVCLAGCQVGISGTGNGQFSFPNSLAVNADAEVYVGESENDRIQKFDLVGNFLTKWGVEGSDNAEFNAPDGVAIDPAGDVYVSDGGNNRIQKFSHDGDFFTKFGSGGTGDGQFDFPLDLDSDPAGNLYVIDRFNNRVQKFGGGPPATSIAKAPKKKTFKRKARLRFSADQVDATFECKLDKRPFKACESPFETKRLKRARHRFKVRAIDLLGVPDPTPAKRSWKVRKR